MAQLQQKQQLQLMQQMQREQSDMDMNGNRPQSPTSADNAPSPSKRPRLADGTVNGQQLAPGGRGQGQGMQGGNPQMLPNGMGQRMNPGFQPFQQGAVATQQKSMQVYAQNLALHHSRSALNSQGIPNGGMMNPDVMPTQGGMVTMPDGQMYPTAMGAEYYGNGQMPQVRPGMAGTPNGQPGNHALQDYQMQLMLLEQQNKRRLMMARQEQDTMARDGQPPMPGQGGLPPGTSPQGSRAGTSPNPSDQMKRGTPKMPQSGLPGSPSTADLGQNRGSPGSMNLNGVPPEMAAQFFQGGPNMRPPSSNPAAFSGPQMGQPIPANAAGRMPSGQWQPGQMPPQHSPASQPQAGTPQDQRGNMPPPQPPGAGNGRAQESPAGGNAPPTPQPATKAAPKKEKKKNPPKQKKNSTANQGTGATPSTEAADPPQTPNPSTPVTPHPPNNALRGPTNATAGAPPQQTSAPAPPPMVPAPDQTPQFPADISFADVRLSILLLSLPCAS